MKDFFQRNMPVFIIGLVTVGVFLLIIITAQKNPTVGPKLELIKKEQFVYDYTPTIGPKDSKMVLIEFSDFECPACKAFNPAVLDLINKYKDRVLFVYKHLPLPQHTLARSAAIASMAANQQNKFWEYGDKLFAVQPDFSQDKFVQLASELGLNLDKFKADLAGPTIAKQVDDDYAQAIRIGLESTPSFILNGQLLQLRTFGDLEKQLKDALLKAGQNSDPVVQETTQSTQTNLPKKQWTADQLAFDKKYGVIEVSYSDLGFNPTNIKALTGQLVRWTNTTKKDMQLEQIIYKYTELSQPVTIKAGGVFELRLTHDGLWTYKEHSVRNYGSIFDVTP